MLFKEKCTLLYDSSGVHVFVKDFLSEMRLFIPKSRLPILKNNQLCLDKLITFVENRFQEIELQQIKLKSN